MTREIITVRIAAEPDIARVRQVSDLVARVAGLANFSRTRMVTAVLEIARNALQYAGGGQVRLSITEQHGGNFIRVLVVDQGEGIDNPAAFERVRRPFLKKGDSSSNGLGLGLSGVKRLADRFEIASSAQGTRIEMLFGIPMSNAEMDEALGRIDKELAALGTADPIAELTRQNRELAEAMAERELLIDEVHHRTGNNLALIVSFIQMSKRGADSDETKQAMAELEGRVHSIARVHQELQRSARADQIELLPLLQNVARHAKDAFSNTDRTIAIDVDGDAATVASATAIDLGLIVGELITNAFKHAFTDRTSGQIDICFRTGG